MSALKYGHPKYWAKRGAGEVARESPGFLAVAIAAAAAFVLLLVLIAWCIAGVAAWTLASIRASARGATRPRLAIPLRPSDARFIPTLGLTVVIVVGGFAFLATRPKGNGQATVGSASIAVARRPASEAAVAAHDRAAFLPGTGVPPRDVSERCRYQSASRGEFPVISYACVIAVYDPKTTKRGVFYSGVACDVPSPTAPTVQATSCMTGTTDNASDQLEQWQITTDGQP